MVCVVDLIFYLTVDDLDETVGYSGGRSIIDEQPPPTSSPRQDLKKLKKLKLKNLTSKSRISVNVE